MDKVYIILLNYLNWEDTIECLVSLASLSYSNFEVVVIDNFSQNESIENIKKTINSKNATFHINYIQLNNNKGFGHGNNIGLKFALNKRDSDYFWVLNNDTVVSRESLTYLINTAKEDSDSRKRIALYR